MHVVGRIFPFFSFTLDRIDTHENSLDKVGIKARGKVDLEGMARRVRLSGFI